MQADSSISVGFEENVLLISTVMEINNPKKESDYLPLNLEFRDSYSAAGKLGGAAYRKREGRATDLAVIY